jgi:uncharacterized paraquat-inducible protein A
VAVGRCARCLKVLPEGRRSAYCRSCRWPVLARRGLVALGILAAVLLVTYVVLLVAEPEPVIWVE